MNKICTTVEQSKKLIELGIDVNTADMHYSTWTILNGGEYILLKICKKTPSFRLEMNCKFLYLSICKYFLLKIDNFSFLLYIYI